MAGTTLNSLPVLTDDGTNWDQPPAQPQQQGSGYWLPDFAKNLAQSMWSGFKLPGDVAQGKARTTDPDFTKRVTDMAGLAMAIPAAAPAEANAANMGFRLYHGSGKLFDKPSNDFIGTGQGAQTYGWGHYGAEAEPVALNMRDQVAFDPRRALVDLMHYRIGNNNLSEPLGTALNRSGLENVASDPDMFSLATKAESEAIANNHYGIEASPSYAKLDKLLPKPQGHMQEWDVNADPRHFLDWDALADEQSPHVSEALARAPFGPYLQEHLDESPKFTYNNPTGKDIHRWLSEDLEPQGVSEVLHRAGIPGVQVLDALSRRSLVHFNRTLDNPALTRNFSITDPNIINVVRRYGIGALGSAGGLGILDQLHHSDSPAM